MSDYYGRATLESWLENEVYGVPVPPIVVALFEKWREPVESSIESWEESDDGDGNSLSWRGWGRGYGSIDEAEMDLVEAAISAGKELIATQPPP